MIFNMKEEINTNTGRILEAIIIYVWREEERSGEDKIKISQYNLKNIFTFALSCVAQWIECRPVNQRVMMGLIPSQGTCLGCRPGPHWVAHESQPHIDVFLPLSLPSPL